MNRRARRTVVLTIGAVIVALILITVVFHALVFSAKIIILLLVVLIGFFALRSAFPKSKSRD
jgi:hypothetical protein